jgi:hypothetical protein
MKAIYIYIAACVTLLLALYLQIAALIDFDDPSPNRSLFRMVSLVFLWMGLLTLNSARLFQTQADKLTAIEQRLQDLTRQQEVGTPSSPVAPPTTNA